MKKITSLSLIILTLFSCLFFVACGNKYSKLNISFYYTSGEQIEELVFIRDENDNKDLEKQRIAIKFSGIDKNDVGQILVTSSPAEVITASNYIYDKNFVYVDLTANRSAIGNLEVKHLSSGKTKSIPFKIKQKAYDVKTTDKDYIVSVNKDRLGTTHYLKTNDIATLIPNGSTDKVYFKRISGTYPVGVKEVTEIVNDKSYIVGFEIGEKATAMLDCVTFAPVLVFEDYEDEIYDDEEHLVDVYFKETLTDDTLLLDTDSAHKDADGNIYDIIYLIANDTGVNVVEGSQYSYNAVNVNLQTKELGEISAYLEEEYDISVVSPDTKILVSHIGNGKIAIQALANTEKPVEVLISLIPQTLIGDVSTITKKVVVKGEVRSNLINVKRNGELVDLTENVDIYDYIYADGVFSTVNGILFNFDAVAKNGAPVYKDLNKVRIKISPEILYSTETNVEGAGDKVWNNIYTDSTFTTKLNTLTMLTGGRKVATQKNLIRIVINNNDYLKFYFDDSSGSLISAPIERFNNIHIKYVETENKDENFDLRLDLLARYEGSYEYLLDMTETSATMNFDKKEGVKSLDVFASSYDDSGLLTHNPITEGGVNKKAETIYLNKDDPKQELLIDDNSIKGHNDKVLTSDVEFDVEIKWKNSSTTNPLNLQGLNNGKLEITSVPTYIPFVLNENTSIDEYTIIFKQTDTNFKKSITCFVYKALDTSNVEMNFGSNDLDDETFKNVDFTAEYGLADYIVTLHKNLNLSINVEDETLKSSLDLIKEYKITAEMLDSTGAVMDGEIVENYISIETTKDIKNYAYLSFIKPTNIAKQNCYIKLNITMLTKKYKDILTEDTPLEEPNPAFSLKFFVYDPICNGTEERVKLNTPYVTRYMNENLGVYNKEESVANIDVLIENESLWQYVQKQGENYVDWKPNGNKIELATLNEGKNISVTTKAGDSGVAVYNASVVGTIKQFYKTINLICEITVKRPVLTEKLNIENTDVTFVALNNGIFEYNVDLKKDEDFEVYAQQTSTRGTVTHKGLKLVVINSAGSSAQSAVRVEGTKIYVNDVQAGLKLIVFAEDVLDTAIESITSGYGKPQQFIKTLDDPATKNIYKKAYIIIHLHLEDGETEATAYSVYNLTDFEEMLNNNMPGKYYQIKNNINLANLSVYNVDFKSNLFGADGNIYNLYNIKLNTAKTNLFKSVTATVKNLCFEVEYNYVVESSFVAETEVKLGLIGSLNTSAKLINVSSIISGESIFEKYDNSYYFGGLVGLNNGEISYTNTDVIGVKGDITLNGTSQINFGGLVGFNSGTIVGTNSNESIISNDAVENKIVFIASQETQGATGNLNITKLDLNYADINETSSIGGLVGINKGGLSNVFVTGVINAPKTDNVGGAIGMNELAKTTNAFILGNNAAVTYSDTSKIKHIKSNVVITAKDNIGGITGKDSYGFYSYCWYQVLPNYGTALVGNEKVGGIVGYATHSKVIFTSVMSYRWNYNELVSTFTKEADIIAKDYVGGIFGYAEITNVVTGSVYADESSIVLYSSVNASLKSNNKIGGIYTSDDTTYANGIIYSAYFMGKLDGVFNYHVVDTHKLCLENKGLAMYNYVYTLNVDGENVISGNVSNNTTFDIDKETDVDFWQYYAGMNNNKIYISSDDDLNKPIFELVPNSLDVRIKADKDDTNVEDDNELDKIEMLYYDFTASTANKTILDGLNLKYNTKSILDIFSFKYSPGGTVRISVSSSDTNVISVVAGTLKINGIGKTTLKFSPLLNPAVVDEIEVDVVAPLEGITVSENSVDNLTSLEIAKDNSKQLYVESYGSAEYLGVYYNYKANKEYGLMVEISGADVDNYIQISGKTPEKLSENLYKVYIPYGTPFSIKALESNKSFAITVTPCVSEGNPYNITTDKVCEFTLNTKLGASEISLKYNSAIVYPNDKTILVAEIQTDIELIENETYHKILELIYDINLNGEAIYGKPLNLEELSKYIKYISHSYNNTTNIQTINFEIIIGESLLKVDENGNAFPSVFVINFKSEYSKMETIEYTILPQKIDKIEAKSYAYKDYASSSIEESEILKPDAVGLIVINISPINGYFDYIEISDVTGDEEIVFIQATGVDGKSLDDMDRPSRDDKGIKLIKVDADKDGKFDQQLYVTMQIDKSYSSKIHTLKLVAYYQNEELRTDYKYVDVKMLPSIMAEYQQPNGVNIVYETDNTGSKDVTDLYFANGTSAQFRITTANATEKLDYSYVDPNADGNKLEGKYEFVNLHSDFYVLRCVEYSEEDLGKLITINLATKAVMENGDFDEATMSITFKIVKYVVHGISLTNTNSNNELYGNFGKNVELEAYFKPTDLTLYDGGLYNNVEFVHDSSLSEDADDTLKSINNILRELNYKLNYKLNPDEKSYVIFNTGKNYVNGGYNEITDDKITLTSAGDKVENILLVEEGYNENAHLAVVFKLAIDSATYNWELDATNTSSTIIDKNYKLRFSKSNSEEDYSLIKNAEDFLAMEPGKENRYILGNDITLSNYKPLDIELAEFDGNGRTITINSFANFEEAEIQAGLFKQIYENMIVKNVNVNYVSVREETIYSFGNTRIIENSAGKVVDYSVEYADICNVPTVNYTSAMFGGLTPLNNGVVTNCSVSGKIALRASTLEKGAGSNYEIAFNIGGLIGTNSETGYVTHSSSELKIFSLANIGGFVFDNQGRISSSATEGEAVIYEYNTGLSTLKIAKVGGFAMQNSGKITMSHTTFDYQYVKDANLCSGMMSSKDDSAGFVHTNSGEIANCYTYMSKIGNNSNKFSGFVDTNSGSITNCYTAINGGNNDKDKQFMFTENQDGLVDCIEFVDGVVVSGSRSLATYGYSSVKDRVVFEKHGFIFGDNSSAVWKQIVGSYPVLTACEDKVRYTGNQSSSDDYYYGLRNLEYRKVPVENENGTTDYVIKVKFTADDNYGSKYNPYIIYSLDKWNDLMFDGTTHYYRIVKDIEFDSTTNPKTSSMVFSGNIQGNDMLISAIKLYLTTSIDGIGLFKKLESAGDYRIENSIRNLKFNIVSVWASKSNALGILAGSANSFNLFNLTIDADNKEIVGGNAVGGIVGIATGNFNIDGLFSNVGVNSTRQINAYQYSIYYSRNNMMSNNNLSSVYYAGSAIGILDAYNYVQTTIEERDIANDYFNVKHIKITGKPVIFGDTVGAAFGFVGELVSVKYVDINLQDAALKGYQYSAGIAGENRGVISDATVEMTGDTTFISSNFVSAGAVGLNIGGLVKNVSVKTDILRRTNDTTVAGIIGRNVNGMVTNIYIDGKLFGNITGAIIGADYSKTVFTSNAGVGGLSKDCLSVELLIPTTEVEFKNGVNPVKIENLKIGKATVDYMFEEIHNIYSWKFSPEKEIENADGTTNIEPASLDQQCYKAYGLYAGMSDKLSSQITGFSYDNESGEITLNGNGGSYVIKRYETKFIVKENESQLSIDNENGVELPKETEDDTLPGTEIKAVIVNSNLKYVQHIYIVGANVASFDLWDRASMSNDFVIFSPEEFIEVDTSSGE